MATNPPQPHLDVAIARLSARQHGNVTWDQLISRGLGKHSISYRLKTGRLHRIHRGVYAVGRPPMRALERAAAAVLACGEGAVLSHLGALALWGFREWPRRFDVIVACDRRPRGIAVHRSELRGRDVRRHQAIRVTSLARTLLDVAPVLSQRALTRTSTTRCAARSSTAGSSPRSSGAITFIPARSSSRRSSTSATAPPAPDSRISSSVCKLFDFPDARTNVKVGGHEVDAYFEAERLIVELDGWDYHSSRDSFERERNRDADELALGLATVRITTERLRRDPAGEAARLHKILRQRRAR